MGVYTHLRDGAPMALIVCVGSLRGGGRFWVESAGLLNPSLRDKSATPVCTRVLRFEVGHARPHRRRPQCCSIAGHYMLLCHGRVSFAMECDLLQCKWVAPLRAYVAAAAY